MNQAELEAFKAQMRANMAERRTSTAPLAEQRLQFDANAKDIPLPEGVRVEALPSGAPPGERLVPGQALPGCAFLYFHGGGFYTGSTRSHRHLVAHLAEAARLTSYSMDYRLAPENRFPAAVEDARAAYRWLLGQGIAAERIVVGGDSAGGNLALGVALWARQEGVPLPGGLYLISPWLDLAQTRASYEARASSDPMFIREGVSKGALLYLQGTSLADPWASPVHADPTGLPRTLIQVGTDEILLSDSLDFASKAALAGVGVRLDVWAQMMHVWLYQHRVIPEGRQAIAEAGVWLRDTVSRETQNTV
jgi:monoterpene epsilon-lactone hydrolase